MCLLKETRSDIVKVLKLKQVLAEKLEHNKNELKKLESMADAETNIKNYNHIQRSIRAGQALISTQTTKILSLSAEKIGKMFDVPSHKVTYQQRVMNGQHL